MADRSTAAATLWKLNTHEGASLYFLDPDGHKLDLHDGSLVTRLASYRDRCDINIYDEAAEFPELSTTAR
jgi:hypothetical protein